MSGSSQDDKGSVSLRGNIIQIGLFRVLRDVSYIRIVRLGCNYKEEYVFFCLEGSDNVSIGKGDYVYECFRENRMLGMV